MLERLPEQVDPLRLARQGAELHGRIPLSRMGRLAESLCDAPGDADVVMRFELGEGGIGLLRGEAHARVSVICQRCLEPMPIRLDAEFAFGLVESEPQAERLEAEYEPLLVGDAPLRISELVEDELILALPIVSLHDLPACPAAGHLAASGPAEHSADTNPFAILETLKRKH